MWGVFAMVYHEIEGVPACGVQVGFYIYNFPSNLSEDVILFRTKLNGAKKDAAPIYQPVGFLDQWIGGARRYYHGRTRVPHRNAETFFQHRHAHAFCHSLRLRVRLIKSQTGCQSQ